MRKHIISYGLMNEYITADMLATCLVRDRQHVG
jgi:hypothetical protein